MSISITMFTTTKLTIIALLYIAFCLVDEYTRQVIKVNGTLFLFILLFSKVFGDSREVEEAFFALMACVLMVGLPLIYLNGM